MTPVAATIQVVRGARALVVVLMGLLAAAAPAHAFSLWAVGDGADSGSTDDTLAAYVALAGPDRFLYLGDVYGDSSAGVGDGSAASFTDYYDPGFGRMKSLTSPTPGNHEFPGHAAGYDPYWGSLAPQNAGGHWYSLNAGGWHLVSLNSEEPIGDGSAQLDWLRSDLAAHGGTCTIVFEHKPRFSDGYFKGQYETTLAPMWNVVAGHAVAVLNGHDHNYQRFKPVNGITEFVVGTGGHGFHAISADSRLAAWNDHTYGALHLTLGSGQAAYEFVASDGSRLDSGGLTCTPPPAGSPPPTGSPPSAPPPQQPAPAPPAPSPAPGPAPVQPRADDDPLLLITRPRTGRVYSAKLRLVAGTARNVRGPVVLTLVRRAHGRCRAYGRGGFNFSCRHRPRLRARGVTSWSFRLPRRVVLRPGVYTLRARAASSSDSAVFRVR